MKKNLLFKLLIVTALFIMLLCSTALACDCGERHAKSFPANAGNTKTYIATAQTQLRQLGYSFSAPSGVRNASMKHAIKAFQYDAHLPQTGVLTSCTLNRLYTRSKAVLNNRARSTWTNIFNGNYRLLEKGMKNSRVRKLNYYLKKLGYNTNPNSNVYSDQTAAAVKAFQRKYVKNRPADGKAGPYTLSTLEKIVNKKK